MSSEHQGNVGVYRARTQALDCQVGGDPAGNAGGERCRGGDGNLATDLVPGLAVFMVTMTENVRLQNKAKLAVLLLD